MTCLKTGASKLSKIGVRHDANVGAASLHKRVLFYCYTFIASGRFVKLLASHTTAGMISSVVQRQRPQGMFVQL